MKRILVLIAAIFLVPINANAHAGLVSSNPAANSEITIMPTTISLTFSEGLLIFGDQKVNSIALTHYDGAAIELSGIQIEGATLSASVPVVDYQSGVYEVVYKIVSADGHELSDIYSFSLNGPTLYTAPNPVTDEGDGVLPMPIVGAIALVLVLGGFFALRARNRKS